MDYEDAQDYIPSKDEIDNIIRQHHLDPLDFWQDVSHGGSHVLAYHLGKLTGGVVLDWLGY